ncbi:Uncharacterised protein [Sphingomonas paucimobilis]|nr:Uncharacterised protein [Sphingomonas paucimobilis]
MRRQIEGELAWNRYLRKRVEPFINVGDEEVNAIRARLEAAKGTEEYNLKEIFLSANEANSSRSSPMRARSSPKSRRGSSPSNISRAASPKPRRAR